MKRGRLLPPAAVKPRLRDAGCNVPSGPPLTNGQAPASSSAQEIAELKAALAEAEDRYTSFYTFAPAAHLSFDEAGVIREYNLEAGNLLGTRGQFAVGLPFSSFVAREDKVKFLEHLRRCETSQGRIITELKLSRHGVGFFAQIRTEAVRWHSPWYRTVLSDLTEREEVETQRRAHATRFRALVENSAEAICVIDADGLINYASPSTVQVIGFAPEEMIGRPARQFFYDEKRSSRPGAIVEFLNRVRHKDGAWRWLEATMTNLLGEPAVLGMVCNFRDITARKVSEDGLLESETRYRVLTESIPQLVWVCNDAGELEFSNSQWGHYTRLNAEQGADGGWMKIIHPEDRAQVQDHWNAVKKHGASGEIECRWRRAEDGAYRWHLVQISEIQNPGGHFARWIGVAGDIHERKEAEQARENFFHRLQAERALLSVQYAVVRALAECATLEEAAPRMLRAFCENIGWHVGELWRVEAATKRLHRVALWPRPEIDAEVLLEKTPLLSFAKGEDVPGHVWAVRKPVWLPDVTQARIFRRKERARLSGLHAGFAFPILCGAEVLGVVEFFHQNVLKPQPALLKIVAAMGSQIGQFIERTSDRAALRQSEEALQRANDELEARVRERTLALQRANRELSGEIARRNRLEREILEISEREQRRLGQDLHDSLCQELAATACLARALATRLHGRGITESKEVNQIAGHVNAAVARARNIARGLHPVEMDAHGLMIALQELTGQVNEEIPCELRCAKPVPVHESELALNLYRIAQEAVNNALKHAQATRLVVELERVEEKLILTVTDDGRGMRRSRTSKKSGLGLHMMEYRARAIGASFSIQAQAPHGTRLTCVLPLHY